MLKQSSVISVWQQSSRGFCRFEAIVAYLQQVNPSTTVVLMGILPWGLVDQNGIYVWPNEYTQGIATVNSLIQVFAAGQSNVHYVDCKHQLFPTGQVSRRGQLRLLECSVSLCQVAARS